MVRKGSFDRRTINSHWLFISLECDYLMRVFALGFYGSKLLLNPKVRTRQCAQYNASDRQIVRQISVC